MLNNIPKTATNSFESRRLAGDIGVNMKAQKVEEVIDFGELTAGDISDTENNQNAENQANIRPKNDIRTEL